MDGGGRRAEVAGRGGGGGEEEVTAIQGIIDTQSAEWPGRNVSGSMFRALHLEAALGEWGEVWVVVILIERKRQKTVLSRENSPIFGIWTFEVSFSVFFSTFSEQFA